MRLAFLCYVRHFANVPLSFMAGLEKRSLIISILDYRCQYTSFHAKSATEHFGKSYVLLKNSLTRYYGYINLGILEKHKCSPAYSPFLPLLP